MKRILAVVLAALLSVAAVATTLNPIQLLNPAGSTSGQVPVSSGPSTPPAWGGVPVSGLAAIAANTVLANATGASAAPTAVAMPACNTSVSALNWTPSTGFTCNTGLITAATASSTYLTTATAASTYTPLASPTGSGTATWPTLKASAAAHLTYQNSSVQSISAAATVTGWTSVFDANSNFNASTGIFTAPATGYYQISGQLLLSTTSPVAGDQFSCNVVANAVVVTHGVTLAPNATNLLQPCTFSVVVSLSAGQTASIQAGNSRTQPLNSAANANWISIVQVP